jgi:maltooligosyltrehalose trehalohydrolase
MSEQTFRACKLDLRAGAERDNRLASLYRRLIALRKEQVIPSLKGIQGHAGRYEVIGARAFQVGWKMGDGSELSLIANLGPEPLDGVSVWAEDHLWLEGFATGHTLDPWSAVFRLTAADGALPK